MGFSLVEKGARAEGQPVQDRRPARPTLLPHEAKQQARWFLSENRLSMRANKVLGALAVAGVLTDDQLRRVAGLSVRTELRYYKRHLLDRLDARSLDLGMVSEEAHRAHSLGLVGLEVAQMKHGRVPTGYLGEGTMHVMHDLLCNEVVIQLLLRAAKVGVKAEWRSKYEATVHEPSGKPLLEPDAMLCLTFPDETTRRLLIEYHNEDDGRRVEGKVGRYEQLYRDGHWRAAWGTEVMPLVLVVWTHRVVGRRYEEVLTQRGARLRCTYLGRSWASFARREAAEWWLRLDGSEEFVNVLASEEKEGA